MKTSAVDVACRTELHLTGSVRSRGVLRDDQQRGVMTPGDDTEGRPADRYPSVEGTDERYASYDNCC